MSRPVLEKEVGESKEASQRDAKKYELERAPVPEEDRQHVEARRSWIHRQPYDRCHPLNE